MLTEDSVSEDNGSDDGLFPAGRSFLSVRGRGVPGAGGEEPFTEAERAAG